MACGSSGVPTGKGTAGMAQGLCAPTACAHLAQGAGAARVPRGTLGWRGSGD